MRLLHNFDPNIPIFALIGYRIAWFHLKITSILKQKNLQCFYKLLTTLHYNFWTKFGISDHIAWSGRDEEYAEE